MKPSLILVFIIFFINNINSQNIESNILNSMNDETNINLKVIDNIIWVRDSIYYFNGDEDDWTLNKKYIVTERESYGKLKSAMETKLDSIGNWILDTYTKVYHFQNENLNDSTILNWDTNTNIWNDTLQYLKLDSKGNQKEKITSFWGRLGFNDYQSHIFYREISEYDENSKITTFKKFKKINNSNWGILSETTYEYYNDGKLFKKKYHNFTHWDIDVLIPEYYSLTTYIFDDQNIQNQIIQLKDHEEDEWLNSKKYIYKYNIANLKSDEIQQNWNEDIDEWENNIHFSYFYNDTLLDYVILDYWDINTFKLNTRTNYKYNVNGKLISIIAQTFSESDSIWNEKLKHIYAYNDHGSKILDELSNYGKKTRKTTYYFDADNNYLGLIYQIGNSDNEWENIQYTAIEYDINSYSTFDKVWNKDNSMWENWSKSINFYDSNGNLIDNEIYGWDNIISKWQNNIKIHYFWSPFTSSHSQNISESDFQIYPNPVQNVLYISSAGNEEIIKNQEYEIISTNGVLVQKGKLNNSLINTTSLDKGTYFIIFKKLMIYKAFVKM
ncbi:MAG: T9SS type A sorting domain-containing protein [Saprospiraceae bacterium]